MNAEPKMQPLPMKTAAAEKKIHKDYFHAAVSVDCVIFGYEDRKLKVLVMPSDLEEFKNLYSLLGDLVGPHEDLQAASQRILKEKTGLDGVYLEQVHAFGDTDRHPSGRVFTVAYYSLLNIKHDGLHLSNPLLKWMPVYEIKQLAFDHKLILETSLAKLRHMAMETPVLFHLLPEKFSLRELQELYEAIQGQELDRRNFRKKISNKGWLVDLKEMEKNVPHRPGKLYRLQFAEMFPQKL